MANRQKSLRLTFVALIERSFFERAEGLNEIKAHNAASVPADRDVQHVASCGTGRIACATYTYGETSGDDPLLRRDVSRVVERDPCEPHCVQLHRAVSVRAIPRHEVLPNDGSCRNDGRKWRD